MERDFYKLHELTEDDIRVVRSLIERSMPAARNLHEGWLEAFTVFFEVRRRYVAMGCVIEAVERELETVITNLEEDIHARVERDAKVLLESLQDRDATFFSDPQAFITFIHFLALQYFRTKRTSGRLTAVFAEFPGFDAARIVGVMRHIFATNVSGTIVGARQHWWIALMYAPPGTEFVTGDQPVLNTYAFRLDCRSASAHGDEGPEKLEFYYPVTPKDCGPGRRREG